MNQEKYQVCTNCVMDTTDTKITFDDQGVCDHCNRFYKDILPSWHTDEKGWDFLQKIVEKIKKEGEGKDFDCIMGMSGGADSSYLLYIAKEKFGLPKEAVMMACSMSLPKLVDQVFAQAQTLEGKVTKKDTKEDLIEAIKEQVIEERSVHYLQKTRGTNDEEIIRG